MIEVQNFTKSKINRRFIKKVIAGTLREMEISDTMSIGVACIGKNRIRKVNKKYRGKDVACDTLSFKTGLRGIRDRFIFPPGEETFLGEILLCPSEIKRRLKKGSGIKYERELAHVLVHSTLHLLGWEHEENGRSRDTMHAKEQEIMSNML